MKKYPSVKILNHYRKLTRLQGHQVFPYFMKIAPTLYDKQYWKFLRIAYLNFMGCVENELLLFECFTAKREFKEVSLMHEHERKVVKNWTDYRTVYCAISNNSPFGTYEWYFDQTLALAHAADKTLKTGEVYPHHKK